MRREHSGSTDVDRRLIAAVLVSLFVVGAVMRIAYASQDLFADELSTYWIISVHGLGGVIDTVHSTAEITPPFSFALSWLASRLDMSPEMLRLPALIGGIGTIPVVYLIGVRTVGRGAALLATALVTLSPFMIYYSAEARGYGLMMFLLLCSTLAMLLALERGGWGWWAGYALFVCATAYTHYTAIFVILTQFVWVLWACPWARRPAILSVLAASALFLPWLSGLKGDLDSPTTRILSALAPFDPDSIRIALEHWSVGFPYASNMLLTTGGLRELPGTTALILLAFAVAVGAVGMLTARDRLGNWFASEDHRFAMLVGLAFATPVGEAIASLIGSNIFGTRNLAASWPYMALVVASVLTVGKMRYRILAAVLATIAFAIGGAKMLTDSDYERPTYDLATTYIEDSSVAVVVDDSAITPGPLSNLDVSLDDGIRDFRLNIPEEREHPFDLADPRPDRPTVFAQAIQAANGRPIALIVGVGSEARQEFIDSLPEGYTLTGQRIFPGLLDLEVLIYDRPADA